MMKHRTLAASGALITALTLAGCATADGDGDGDGDGMNGMNHGSDSGSSDSSSSSEWNDSDVAFAMMMIPHHEQAVEMSDLLLAKTGIDPRVVTLAEEIKAAQQPEIDEMEDWLDDWGQDMGGMEEGMDHGGMMSAGDMAALDAAAGPVASRLFLEQMIEHHEGAIDMAEDEVTDGKYPEAVDLAGRIVETQTAEIATMEEILTTL